MVAISLYNGNLHRVPDVPRRWPYPPPKISLRDFKILLRRRSRALSRLRSSSDFSYTDGATTSSPSFASSPNHSDTDRGSSDDDANDRDGDNHVGRLPGSLPKGDLKEGEGEMEEVRGERNVTRDERKGYLGKLMEKTDAFEVQRNEQNVEDDDKSEIIANTVSEKSNTENISSDEEKRKKEVKEKLEILNEKKHSLVQVLKQILSAEEKLKRQNSTQGASDRPQLQVDTTTDYGSMIKVNTSRDSGSMINVNTSRVGPDENPCGDVEGGEADDVSNHNLLSCHLLLMSSTSPSSDSQHRKPTSSMVPH